MSTRYNSSRELGQKSDSEGGLAELIFGYGLSVDDLPPDMPDDVRQTITALTDLYDRYTAAEAFLADAAETDPVEGDWDYEDGE